MGFAEQPGDGAHIQGTRDGVPGHLTLPGHAEKGSGGEEALGVRPSTRDLQKGLCHLPIFSRGPPIGAESHRCAPLLQGLTPLTTTCIPNAGPVMVWQAPGRPWIPQPACLGQKTDILCHQRGSPHGHGLLVVYQEGWHRAGPCHESRGAGGTELGFVASLCEVCGPAQLEGSLLLFCPSKIPVREYLSRIFLPGC